MVSMTAFVGVGRAVAWGTVAMQFIGWLLHQVITELTLLSDVQTSRLNQLNELRERINLLWVSSRVCLCATRRHSPASSPSLRQTLDSDRLGHSLYVDRRLFNSSAAHS